MLARRFLGKTGLSVTELCFGALPFGPLQKNLDEGECADVLAAALDGGVDFVDTAQMYRTYGAIRRAMERTGKRPVIASKSAAADREGMDSAVEEARAALGIDTIDIMHLHAARAGADVFEKRAGALESLCELKAKGRVKAIGVSAHSVAAVRAAAARPEIDIVFPILNITGIGILEGSRGDMEKAIGLCAAAGKGVYLMKALGGGSLVGRYAEAVGYARSVPGIASVAMGMVSRKEVDYNLRAFSGETSASLPNPDPSAAGKGFMVLPFLCLDCGKCREACPNGAIGTKEGKASINGETCLRCGYCVGSCPQFAIRMV